MYVVYYIYIADRDVPVYFIGSACIRGVTLVGQWMLNHKGCLPHHLAYISCHSIGRVVIGAGTAHLATCSDPVHMR